MPLCQMKKKSVQFITALIGSQEKTPSCSRLKGKVRRVRVGKLYSVQVRYRRTDRRILHLRGASAKKPIDSQR